MQKFLALESLLDVYESWRSQAAISKPMQHNLWIPAKSLQRISSLLTGTNRNAGLLIDGQSRYIRRDKLILSPWLLHRINLLHHHEDCFVPRTLAQCHQAFAWALLNKGSDQ